MHEFLQPRILPSLGSAIGHNQKGDIDMSAHVIVESVQVMGCSDHVTDLRLVYTPGKACSADFQCRTTTYPSVCHTTGPIEEKKTIPRSIHFCFIIFLLYTVLWNSIVSSLYFSKRYFFCSTYRIYSSISRVYQ